DLRCVVALAAEGEKDIGSTEAMTHTAKTSPYFDPWIADVERSLAEARAAILARDFDRIAQLAEASCLRMHASALAADPGILYWKGATVELIHAVRAMRKRGTPAFFTIDAGPHVKVFCTPDSEAKIASELGQMPGVLDVLTTRPGLGVRVMEHTPTR
ncbi:MAG: diphosphomevalonate decarboxylase, partial [Myxococcota bacterium]